MALFPIKEPKKALAGDALRPTQFLKSKRFLASQANRIRRKILISNPLEVLGPGSMLYALWILVVINLKALCVNTICERIVTRHQDYRRGFDV